MLGRICHLSWMKVAIAQCFVPGSSITFRSRATPFGQSSRNAPSEFAMPVSDAASAGDPVPAALKMKRPRGPPASCVCSRTSLLLRHSPPILSVCVPFTCVSVVARCHVFSERSHGRLGENPSSGLV